MVTVYLAVKTLPLTQRPFISRKPSKHRHLLIDPDNLQSLFLSHCESLSHDW